MRYLINFKYDGSSYYGFQIQKDKITVEETLEKTISQIFNEKINLIGCSRTDRGVHALDFYAHFDSEKEKDINILKDSINKMCDGSIYIKNIKFVSNDFHARYNVKNKEYVYKIYTGEYDPVKRSYSLEYKKPINIPLLKKVANKLEGKHDFKAFTTGIGEENSVRRINYIKIVKEKEYVNIYINSTGFLRYMVRNIIGLMLEINEGKKDISIISQLFKNKDRTENAKTAVPHGLYLNKVNY